MISLLDKVENTVGKGENAGYQHFLLFLQCFPKPSSQRSLKVRIVWNRVNIEDISFPTYMYIVQRNMFTACLLNRTSRKIAKHSKQVTVMRNISNKENENDKSTYINLYQMIKVCTCPI